MSDRSACIISVPGSHFDFFQTPPSSPSVPDLQGMPLPSSSAPPSPSETASEVAPATASLSQTEDAPLAETAAEVEGVPCIEGAEGRSLGAASGCVTGGPLQGVVTGNMAIMGGDMQGVVTEGVAMTLLQQLLEQHRAVAGLCTGQDGVAEVLGKALCLLHSSSFISVTNTDIYAYRQYRGDRS